MQPKLILPKDMVLTRPDDKIFFLAGPIFGAGDWQKQAITMLHKIVPDAFIVCPCRYNINHEMHRFRLTGSTIEELERIGMTPFSRQTFWERYYLNLASKQGCIIFWLPEENKQKPRPPEFGPYAQDTYGELGEWRARTFFENANVVIGSSSPRFPGLSVIRANYQTMMGKYFVIYDTLEKTIRSAVEKSSSPVKSNREHYPEIGKEEFARKFESVLTPSELENVMTAYVFAKYGHGHKNQQRDDGIRYFEHPKAVALMVMDELRIVEWQTIVMALLHDIVEDSFILSWQRIEKNFGREVTLGVKLLTKEPKDGYIERLMEFGAPNVILVKLCDRIHNMRTLGACAAEKRRRQVEETREKFLPLCDVLLERLPEESRWRVEYIKNELEKLCMAYS